jgi:hypothetical protein
MRSRHGDFCCTSITVEWSGPHSIIHCNQQRPPPSHSHKRQSTRQSIAVSNPHFTVGQQQWCTALLCQMRSASKCHSTTVRTGPPPLQHMPNHLCGRAGRGYSQQRTVHATSIDLSYVPTAAWTGSGCSCQPRHRTSPVRRSDGELTGCWSTRGKDAGSSETAIPPTITTTHSTTTTVTLPSEAPQGERVFGVRKPPRKWNNMRGMHAGYP